MSNRFRSLAFLSSILFVFVFSCQASLGVTQCIDTDGGRDYYLTGTAIVGWKTLEDQCLDEFTLVEKYCSGSQINWEYYKCPIGCDDGACIFPGNSITGGIIGITGYQTAATQITISGYVRTSAGTPVSGASVESLDATSNGGCPIGPPAKGSATTDSSGYYSFTFPQISGYCNYVLTTPSKSGCTFSPANDLRLYTGANINKDFGATCGTSCSNECTTSGLKECASLTSYRTCGNYDSDSCLEWSTSASCPMGQTCSSGQCITSPQFTYSTQNKKSSYNIGDSITSYWSGLPQYAYDINAGCTVHFITSSGSAILGDFYVYCGDSGLGTYGTTKYDTGTLTQAHCFGRTGPVTNTGQMLIKDSQGNTIASSNIDSLVLNCPAACTDSDGDSPYTIGYVTGYDKIGQYYNNAKEQCWTSVMGGTTQCTGQDCAVAEFICMDNLVQTKIIYCPNGCSNGACIQICTEGQTKSCGSNVGICKQGIQTCVNGNWATCTGSINPTTEICSNGLDDDCDGMVDENCQTCADPDGINYYTKGTIYTNSGNFTDYCYTSTGLVEFYCSGSSYTYTYYACPYGCSNGACIQQIQGCIEGNACTISEGQSVIMMTSKTGNHTVRLIGVASATQAVMSVDGFTQTVTKGVTYTIAGTSVYINDIYYFGKEGQLSQVILTLYTQACTDSDGGKDYYVYGEAKETRGNSWSSGHDECVGPSNLNEIYCENGSMKLEPDVECEYGCSQGACLKTKPTCYDSDPQNDPYVKGYATIDNGLNKFYDYCGTEVGCVSGSCLYTLTQRYCDDYKISYKFYECPNGCLNGACIQQTCSDGIQDNGETGVDCGGPCPACQIQTCTDSDGGINYYVKGYVTYEGYVLNGELIKDFDVCAKDVITGNDVVQEKYCTSNGIGTIDYACPNGCSNGACINQTCTDSDGGKNYYTRGKGTGPYGNTMDLGVIWGENPNKCEGRASDIGTSVHYDCCVDSTKYKQLNEAYCENGTLWAVGYDCPYGCSNGACITTSQQTCYENQPCTIAEGSSATITTSLGNYTVKMIGASTWTQAVISVNDINKQVTVGATYLIAGANVFIKGIFMSDSINYTNPLSIVELILSTQICTDSDDGKNYYVKGTIGANTDTCYGNYLHEYFCVGSGVSVEEYLCPNGCSNGACIQQQTCPSSIDISFSKDSYYSGENASVTIIAFDTYGKPIPNYAFLIEMESGGQKFNTTMTTDSDGRYFTYGPIGYYQAGGAYTYKVSTTTQGCPVRSDSATIIVANKTCIDNCSYAGQRVCLESNKLRICGDFNQDSCLEWSIDINCPSGTTCQAGRCVASTASLTWWQTLLRIFGIGI